MAWTKEERAEYMKRYRQENRERLNANKKYWYHRHLESERARARVDSKTYYDKRKDNAEFKQKKNEYAKKWRANNREKWNSYQRKHYAKKRGEINANNVN